MKIEQTQDENPSYIIYPQIEQHQLPVWYNIRLHVYKGSHPEIVIANGQEHHDSFSFKISDVEKLIEGLKSAVEIAKDDKNRNVRNSLEQLDG